MLSTLLDCLLILALKAASYLQLCPQDKFPDMSLLAQSHLPFILLSSLSAPFSVRMWKASTQFPWHVLEGKRVFPTNNAKIISSSCEHDRYITLPIEIHCVWIINLNVSGKT